MWKCKKLKASGEAKGAVALVHGLFMYGLYFAPLARLLRREGYDVYLCDYPTRRYGIAEHGRRFACILDRIAAENSPKAASLHIVTHSLGGTVARVALSLLEGQEVDGLKMDFASLRSWMIGRTVMLAPPNKGSDTARLATKVFPWCGRFARPLPELSSAPEAAVHALPIPRSFEIGIVAGSCDIEVAVHRTRLESASASKTLRSDHTLMPFYPHVRKEILSFLKTGAFRE
jgi:pimeloyl-ACP methyl ester carboxylesterase